MHLSFLTSHNLLFFSLCKSSKKTTFSVFLSFFLVKLSKSQSLKLKISRTAWPILMILVSFCRILNGRSDEINLFWRCSSPLSDNAENAHSRAYVLKFDQVVFNSLVFTWEGNFEVTLGIFSVLVFQISVLKSYLDINLC